MFEAWCWMELVILLATSTCAKQTCEIPSVQVDKATTLTCTFDVDVTVLKKSIIVLHYRENSPGEPGSKVRCGVLETFASEGSRVKLEFIFENTVDALKKDVVVYRNSLHDKNMDPVIVLDCHWEGNHKCLFAEGYKSIIFNSSNIVLEITHINKHRSGKYVCQEIPTKTGNEGVCIVHILESVSHISNASTVFPSSVNNGNTDSEMWAPVEKQTVYFNTTMIVLSVLGLFSATTLIAVIIACISVWKRIRPFQKTSGDHAVETQEVEKVISIKRN